jgi:hypothetical protein
MRETLAAITDLASLLEGNQFPYPPTDFAGTIYRSISIACKHLLPRYKEWTRLHLHSGFATHIASAKQDGEHTNNAVAIESSLEAFLPYYAVAAGHRG